MIDIVWSPRGWITSFHSRLANNKQQEFKKKTEYIIEQYAEENMKQESIIAYEKKILKAILCVNHLYINIHIHTNIFTQII